MKRILFICKHNRFRSKVAEALLKKEIEERQIKNMEVKSAGVFLDWMFPYVSENVHKILMEKGMKVEDKSREVNDEDTRWADKIIIVADNVSLDLFPKAKREVWKISDCDQSDEEGIRERTEKIAKKVNGLIKKIK